MKKIRRFYSIILIALLLFITLNGCPSNIFYGLEPKPNDSDGPVLTIINPTQSQIVSGSIAIVGTATDKYQINAIRYKVDAGAYILMSGVYTFSAVLNTTLLTEGIHTIAIEGADKFGNTTTSVRSIIVDQEIPNVTITMDYLNYQNYIRGTNVILSGDAIDDNGISLIQISFDGGLTFNDTVKSADLLDPTWSYTISDTSIIKPGGGGDGLLTVVLRVIDISELRGSTSFPLYVDNTNPTITMILPLNDVTIDSSNDLNNDMLIVSGLCSDNIAGGIKDITISIPGISPVITTNFTTQYLEYIDISSIKSDGLKVITTTIEDKAGNTATVLANIALDDTPPEFIGNISTGKGVLSSDLMLRQNNFKDGTYTISGNVSDPDGLGNISSVRVSLIDNMDTVIFNNLANYAAGSFTYDWFIDGSIPEDIYTLKIRVSDAVGGFDTRNFSVRIDRTIPIVVVSAPLVNSRVAGNAVNVAGLAESTGSGLYSVTYQFTDDGNAANNTSETFSRPNFTGLNNNDVANGTSYDLYFSRGWDTTPFSIGFDLTITINAEDLAGNSSTTTSLNSIVVQKDPTTPQISVDTYDHPTNVSYSGKPVINGRHINGNGILHGTATDDGQVVSLEIKVDSGSYTAISITPSSLVNWDYTLSNLSEGPHVIIFKVTDDTLGTPKILETQLQVNIDNTNPVLNSINLALEDNSGTSYLHGLVNITGVSSDTRAGIESVVVTVNETGISANADALTITGTTSFSGVWDTEALPANGPVPIIAKDGINFETIITDKAGNVLTNLRSENVRPYIISISKTTAYLGEANIIVTGHNFYGNSVDDYTLQPAQNFIAFGDTRSNVNCTANNTVNPNTITVSIPSGFNSQAVNSYGLSSGNIIVNTAGITNSLQYPVKIDIFFTQNIYTLSSPNYPSISIYGTTRAIAFAIGTNPRTFGLMTDSGTNTIQPSASTGGSLNLTSLAYVNDSLQYVAMYSTRLSPSGIWLWRSSNKFATVDGGFPKLIATDGTYSSVKVDGSGNVHIAYYDSTDSNLKYKKSTDQGSNFSSPTTLDGITSSSGTWLSMALSSSGNPYIVYYDDTSNAVKFIYSSNGGSSWSSPITISNNNDGNFGNGIIIDNTGGIHISFYNGNSGDLMYAYAANYNTATLTGFAVSTVDTLVIAGMFSSIAVDSSNNPHITYADFTNIKPKYAFFSSGTWKKIYIAEPSDFVLNANSNFTATAIDNNGFIRMIYPTTTGIREAIYLKED